MTQLSLRARRPAFGWALALVVLLSAPLARGQAPAPPPAAPAPASPTPAAPAPTRPLPPSAAPAPAPAPTVLMVSAPPKDEPVTDKWWFWTAIGGAIVATAAVLIIATRPEKVPSTKLGNMEAFR